MTSYLFDNRVYSPNCEAWQHILQSAYAGKLKPICLCKSHTAQLFLYIALSRGRYRIKRLPYSGPRHAPHCDHYEPPPELSGIGQVSGSAIRENVETQTTTLSLDFALTKGRSRLPSTDAAIEHESVRSDGAKLTMRGLFHLLMDDAGLTRWTPAMAQRRSWFVVRRELLQATSMKIAKGLPLSSLIHIPERFELEAFDAIRQRQRESLARLAQSSSARMILLAEVKAIENARYGKCLIVKHMPDTRWILSDDLHKRMLSRFSDQFELWALLDGTHLLMLATVSQSTQGVLAIESICLINVNAQWIPFDSLFEWELLQLLHNSNRRFTKGLRYNLPSSKAIASAVLQDTGPLSTALFVVPQGQEVEYALLNQAVQKSSELAVWKWHVGAEQIPELPPCQ